MVAAFVTPASSFALGSGVGGFEIDGNTSVDHASLPADPLDWSSPPPNLTTFTDVTGATDESFGNGSKELEPNKWSYSIGGVQAKDDLLSGAVAFRFFGGKQFVYVDWTRLGTSGEAHVEYEFNKSTQTFTTQLPPLGSGKSGIPRRTNGDMVIAFDTNNGGASFDIGASSWSCSTTDGAGNCLSGVFTPLATGAQGSTFDGAVNGKSGASSDIGVNAGSFGEAVLDLTDTIGNFECNEFGQVWMHTRSSGSISAELKDRTAYKPFNPGTCPVSSLDKAVRNVTAGGDFGPSAAAAPGDTVEYRLAYVNNGTATAHNVTITDSIPADSSFVSCTDSCSGPTAGVLSWSLGNMSAGATKTVTFQAQLGSTFADNLVTVHNVAQTASTEEGSKDSNDATVAVAAPADSSLAKSVRNVSTGGAAGSSSDAGAGDTIEYALTYRNDGSGPASDVTIVDEVPELTTFVSCSDACTVDGSTVTWSLGTVPAQSGDVVVTFRVMLDPSFEANTITIPNVAVVSTTQEGATDSNDADVSVTAAPGADLDKAVRNVTTGGALSTSADAGAGDTIEYALTYLNDGTGPAHDVVVEDQVPALTTFESCTDQCEQDGDTLTWRLGSVASGDSVTVTFRVALDETFEQNSTTIPNVGHASAESLGQTDSNPADVNVTALPDSSLDKSVRNVSDEGLFAPSAAAGAADVIEYKLVYRNDGTGPASDVTILEQVPSHSTFDSCSDGCVVDGDQVTWSLGSIPAGGTATVTLRVVLDSTYDANTATILNVASVLTNQEGSTDSNEVDVNVDAPPDLRLDKVASVASAAWTDPIAYTITYFNAGSGPARDVVITDPIPAKTTLVACTPECVPDGSPATSVSWSIGDVAAQSGGSVGVTVVVQQEVGCQICNTATAFASNQDSVQSTRCIDGIPGSLPQGAHASGNAFGAHVQAGPVDQTIAPATSQRDGLGPLDKQSAEVQSAVLPAPATGQISVLRSTAASEPLTDASTQSEQTSIVEVGGVSLLGGMIRASLVKSVAHTVATGSSAQGDADGSRIADLWIAGTPYTDPIEPNTRVDIPGGYVILHEVTTDSAPGHAANVAVTMIHVHLTGLAGTIDVAIAGTTAHADFPAIQEC